MALLSQYDITAPVWYRLMIECRLVIAVQLFSGRYDVLTLPIDKSRGFHFTEAW